MRMMGRAILTAGMMAAGTGVAAADLPPLSVANVGTVALPPGSAGAIELGGLSYVGGDTWLTVSDATAELIELEVVLDSATGAIQSAEAVGGVTLASAADPEGIAWDPITSSVWISNESGPAIRRHDSDTGAVLQTLGLPAVYSNVRSNFSLESLTRHPLTGELWTANEEALSVDGPVSTTSAGTVVRLQRFDASGAPAGQWAYLTERISEDSPLIELERSGVADLVALPDGRLLVLERELAAALPPFTNRLYLVDFDGATDVSALAELEGQTYTPVNKTLLWEMPGFANFEGIGLGPMLDDGSYSLLLVSDDQGGTLSQSLHALRISGVVPEPGLLTPIGLVILGLLRRRAHVPRLIASA